MTILVGQALTLRPPRESDVAERFALGNDAEIMRMFGVDPSTIPSLTLERARRWVEALATHPHAWIVEHRRRFLGEVRLDELDRQKETGRLAIGFYDPHKLGRALGREAVGLVMAHAFGALGLTRLILRVVAYNERAIRCYRACGFAEITRERDAVVIAGTQHDDVVMEATPKRYSAAVFTTESRTG